MNILKEGKKLKSWYADRHILPQGGREVLMEYKGKYYIVITDIQEENILKEPIEISKEEAEHIYNAIDTTDIWSD